MEDLIEVLIEDPRNYKDGEKTSGKKSQLKLMSTPVFNSYVTDKDVSQATHISRASNRFSISDNSENILILKDTKGNILLHLTDISPYPRGVHTVDDKGDLIYIDNDSNIKKIKTNENGTMITLIKKTESLMPLCVYSSPSNGDLLVGMYNNNTGAVKVERYDRKVQHIQTIQDDSTGQALYSFFSYITENRNGDVIVSGLIRLYTGAVVVTTREGRHRFSYTGPPSGSGFAPLGICTDALSQILVCELNTQTVQIIDKDGHLLSLIETRQHGLDRPVSLSYDPKAHLLWVGSSSNNRIGLYRYIGMNDRYREIQEYLGPLPINLKITPEEAESLLNILGLSDRGNNLKRKIYM